VVLIMAGRGGALLTVVGDMDDPDIGAFRDGDYNYVNDTPRDDNVTITPTRTPAPVGEYTPPTDTNAPIIDHTVFEMLGRHEFDRGARITYPYDPDTDIDDELTIRMWFRRDKFNTHQFLIAKGHWGDRAGWRLMIKQTKPPYQYEQIQFDVGNKKSLNYYKTLDGITDSDWHSVTVLFNAGKIYKDSKGVETHGVILLDGEVEYYMACPPEDERNPPIADVTRYREPMWIGRHSDKANKYHFTGMLANITIEDVDIGIDAAKQWHQDTKDDYNQ